MKLFNRSTLSTNLPFQVKCQMNTFKVKRVHTEKNCSYLRVKCSYFKRNTLILSQLLLFQMWRVFLLSQLNWVAQLQLFQMKEAQSIMHGLSKVNHAISTISNAMCNNHSAKLWVSELQVKHAYSGQIATILNEV